MTEHDHEPTGVVEFVITSDHEDWETYWRDLEEGAMLLHPDYGRIYVPIGLLGFIKRG